MVPYGKQFIDNKDIAFVNKALRSNFLTTGPLVEKFENKINNYLGSSFSLVCNSGTSALHLAFLSIKIKPGDVIIMPAVNFVSSFNICNNLRAKIFMADIDPYTGRMRPEDIEDCVKKYKLKKIKAIVNMHLGGACNNISNFYKLKKKYKCLLIEDACHAFGSTYKIKDKIFKIGCAKHVDISTFSFHPIKSITTAEGGALTTNNKAIYREAQLLRSHGMHRKKYWKHWDYDILMSGYNFRLSDFNCALGISQINKIKYFLKKRRQVADFYSKSFKKRNINVLYPKNNLIASAWHLYIIFINFKNQNQKEKFFLFMKKNKIIVQFHYKPIYLFKIGKDYKKLPGCDEYYKKAVSLPIFVDLDKAKQLKIISLINKFLNKYKIK